MRNPWFIGIASFLIGVLSTGIVLNHYFIPVNTVVADDFLLGMQTKEHEIFELLEEEFGLTSSVSDTDRAVISTKEKALIVKERNDVKTIEIYDRTNH